MIVSELNVYPIKSCAPVSLESVEVEAEGLRSDRRFMVIRPNGDFITARKLPRMLGVNASMSGSVLTLSTPDSATAKLDVSQLPDEYLCVSVWKDTLQGQVCTPQVDEFLSRWLDTEVRLVHLGPRSERAFRSGGTVSFADGAPILVTNTASLEKLNRHLANPVSMRRFRPNIVVEGATAFAEHSWVKLRIGEMTFVMERACERCVLTTIDEYSWQKDPDNEPLRTLRTLNRDADGKINFGHNAVATRPGTIKVGDKVEVLGDC